MSKLGNAKFTILITDGGSTLMELTCDKLSRDSNNLAWVLEEIEGQGGLKHIIVPMRMAIVYAKKEEGHDNRLER